MVISRNEAIRWHEPYGGPSAPLRSLGALCITFLGCCQGHLVSIHSPESSLREHKCVGLASSREEIRPSFAQSLPIVQDQPCEVASRTCCKSEAVSPRGVSILSGHLLW